MTESYPDLLANWNRSLSRYKAANFGWGADRYQNILWRLNNGELDGVDPKVVILLAGTNNIGRGESAEEVTKALQATWIKRNRG